MRRLYLPRFDRARVDGHRAEVVSVDIRKVLSEVAGKLDAFYAEDGNNARYVALGWATWALLRYQLGKLGYTPGGEDSWATRWPADSEFPIVFGAQVVVDDTVKELIRPLPGAQDVRFGGR